jgi:uncharacterized protein
VKPELRNLIALQDVELKIFALQREISEIPNRVQAFREELENLKRTHQERAARAAEMGKERRSLEGNVEMMRTKLAKLKDQLMAVKTNKEYTAMLHEIQGAEGQIRDEEDKILESMEQMEASEQGLKAAEHELGKRSKELETEIRQAEASLPGLEADMGRLREEAAGIQAQIGSDLLGRYKRIANARRGIALAEAKEELCSACHVRIRPQVYADLFRTEEIFACDSCSRILFSRDVPKTNSQ